MAKITVYLNNGDIFEQNSTNPLKYAHSIREHGYTSLAFRSGFATLFPPHYILAVDIELPDGETLGIKPDTDVTLERLEAYLSKPAQDKKKGAVRKFLRRLF